MVWYSIEENENRSGVAGISEGQLERVWGWWTLASDCGSSGYTDSSRCSIHRNEIQSNQKWNPVKPDQTKSSEKQTKSACNSSDEKMVSHYVPLVLFNFQLTKSSQCVLFLQMLTKTIGNHWKGQKVWKH